MTTLRIKSENGTLKCEYSEYRVSPYFTNKTTQFIYPDDMERFESSFQPITLSEEAREYFDEIAETYMAGTTEFSGLQTECFEVKAEYTGYSSDIDGKPEYEPILHLKSVPVVENVSQINSQTKCPTCGSTVTVGGDGTSQFYIPIENVVAGDGIKSAKEYFGKEYGFKHIERVVEMKDYKSLYGLMEEFASQYKQNHSEEKKLIALGKELLKHKWYDETEYRFNVPVSEIIKAFDTLGISLESKTEI